MFKTLASARPQSKLAPPSSSKSSKKMQQQPQSQPHLSSQATTSGIKSSRITVDNINPHVLKAEYAVRGAVLIRANEIQKQIEEAKKAGKPSPFGFDEIVFCNIGNPQSLEQKPISFFRNVMTLTLNPELLQNENITSQFKPDVVKRAKEILSVIPGNTGAYSHSMGLEGIRKDVANFIEKRDGVPSDPNKIFLTDGASPAVQMILKTIIRDKNDGIMIPIPQYPLYSAVIELCGGSQVPYYLEEEKAWGLTTEELKRSLHEARSKGVNVRALCVINPGNPTGSVLERDNMTEIVKFCAQENVLLMADEVYQENIYSPNKKWYSFKRVVFEEKLDKDVQLISFHSVSKGFLGECGRRGGYMELHNIDSQVVEQLYKMASVNLCSNVDGQIMVDLMVKPPQPGDPSFEEYANERDSILQSLKRRAEKLQSKLNQLEGVKCNPAEGAMYLFPRITIPESAIKEAEKLKMKPDLFYSLKLLEGAGVCVVPGSGFGQKPGTFHYRTTFLPPENQIDAVVERMTKFHTEFLKKYA